MNLQIDGCINENGIFEAIKDIIRDNSVSPAEDYFNGNVLGLTKNPTGERYTSFYEKSRIPNKKLVYSILAE